MASPFAAVAQAMKDNPKLAEQVMAAGTPAERAEILMAAGIPVPTQADVQTHQDGLQDVSGAGFSPSTTLRSVGCAVADAAGVGS